MIRNFVLLILFSYFNTFALANTYPIDAISSEDKKYIKLLFEQLFKVESLGYTLYFDKPMAFSESVLNFYSDESILESMRIDEYTQYILEGYQPSQVFIKGWKLWEKYRNLLPINHYLLIKRKFKGLDAIFLINKQAFKETIIENFKLFKKRLGEDITAEKLLYQIEKEDADIFEVFHQFEDLLGILLGFGKHNAKLFQQREQVEKLVSTTKFWSLSSPINKKLQNLWDTLQANNKYSSLIISSPSKIEFVGDCQHVETLALQKKYLVNERKLIDFYFKDNWFEHILMQLSRD